MLGLDISDRVVLALSLRTIEAGDWIMASETEYSGALFIRRSDLWGRESPVGEPFGMTETLLGVVGRGGRFICNGLVAEDEYGDVSMPVCPGRLDGKGGVWRDMVCRRRRLLSSLEARGPSWRKARLLCNKSSKMDFQRDARPVMPPFFVLNRDEGHWMHHAHLGTSAAQSFCSGKQPHTSILVGW